MTSTQEKNEPFSIALAARDLLVKYEEMRALRRHARDGSLDDPRPRMRALSSRFPGALREIDDLPDAEIDARIDHLTFVTRGEQAAAWVEASWRYHRALAERFAAGPRAGRPTELALDEVSRALGLSIETLRGLLHPHAKKGKHRV